MVSRDEVRAEAAAEEAAVAATVVVVAEGVLFRYADQNK